VLDQFSPLILVWAFTYFIHSSTLIAIAYLFDRGGLLKKTRNAELVWRFALMGGLLTSAAQLWLSSANDAQNAITTPSLIEKTAASPSKTLALIPPLEYPLRDKLNTVQDEQKTSNTEISSTARNVSSFLSGNQRFNQTPLHIELPSGTQQTTKYLVMIWALIAALGCMATYRSARHLNRLAAYFPDADKDALKQLLNRVSDRDQTRIQLKVSEQWNSPFVTPDSTICIPRWAYTDLTQDQRDAMLAHEVAHVLRRDPAWRVAMQLLARICFFQPLHHFAIHKLELLAELACDERAAQTSGKPHQLAEALYACAKVTKTNEAPSLALAMSRRGSPLLKRITSLLDQDLLRQAAIPQSRTAISLKYGLLSVGLLAMVYSTPNIMISFEKANPQLLAVMQKVKRVTEAAIPNVSGSEILTQIVGSTTPSPTPKIYEVSTTPEQLTEQESSKPHLAQAPEVLPSKLSAEILQEATGLRDKKDFNKAARIYQVLADKGSVEAQQALGEMYWYGNGVTSNPQLAAEWFKKAASNGSLNAEKYLALLNEREKRIAEINYYLEEFDGKDLKFSEMNCTRPDFSDTAKNSVDIENMIGQMNEFATCFNKYGEKLNSSKNLSSVIPNELLRLMTEAEIDKAMSRSTRTLATIRLMANMIADDFTMEKRSWESRTREYFKGARSRDWVSIKRVALVNGVDPELAVMHDPQLVRVNTETRLHFNGM
jgi:beta-lactamase regulating signal transducer with metallopeptidase domain